MASHGSSPDAKRAGAHRPSFVLRCLLLLVAWQGPLPWCHCHGTLANSADSTAVWLATHLRSRHSSVSPFANVSFGWHIHIELPDSTSDDPDQPPRPDRDRLPVTNAADGLAELAARPAAALISEADLLDLACQGGMLTSDGGSCRLTAHFFDDFAPSLPLPMRFCVARC